MRLIIIFKVLQTLQAKVFQANYQDDLLVAQQNIQSLQESLLELESQQDRQQGNLTIMM